MPKRRKNVILVCLVLLTSMGILCLAIVTVMLMGRPLSNTTMARGTTTMASSTSMTKTPQELLVSADMQQRFSVLSKANTNYCANIGNRRAIDADMAQVAQDSYLQGSCCSPMDRTRYEQQIHTLKAYAYISQIPADPYNVPVSLARTLSHYDQSIQLTAAQQATYNQASAMTDDHGWCCCQCWAWYVHSGLAKYLIAAQHFSATQVAAVINAEDCCGGA